MILGDTFTYLNKKTATHLLAAVIFVTVSLVFINWIVNNDIAALKLVLPKTAPQVRACENPDSGSGFDNDSSSIFKSDNHSKSNQQKEHFYDSSRLSIVTRKPLFVGCVKKSEAMLKDAVKMTSELKFEPVDCSLFCIGRNFSRVNIHSGQNSTCFCSNDVPVYNSPECERETTTDRNIFKSYKLGPFKLPAVKVQNFVSFQGKKIYRTEDHLSRTHWPDVSLSKIFFSHHIFSLPAFTKLILRISMVQNVIKFKIAQTILKSLFWLGNQHSIVTQSELTDGSKYVQTEDERTRGLSCVQNYIVWWTHESMDIGIFRLGRSWHTCFRLAPQPGYPQFEQDLQNL